MKTASLVIALSLTIVPAVFAQAPAAAPVGRFERVDTADQMRTGRVTNPNDRVCRSITATGSRLGARRQCRTRQEWADLARDHRENADQVTRDSLRGTTIANTGG